MSDDHDHRQLAQRFDLFHFQEEAPGMVFWHPNGLVLYRLLESAVRSHTESEGYAEVRTPLIMRRPVWEASGHWEHFRESMFRVDDDEHEAAVKPVSCPGHVYIAERRNPSYRDLPLRFAEFGTVHRDEPSGTLQGLLRLRQFTQDDGHVFCMPEQAEGEVERFCRAVMPFYAAFGFDRVAVVLSTRPEHRAGDDASWDHAERALSSVAPRLGWDVTVQPGGGAFYGPKLEFVLADRLRRKWQCGTIQFDLVMPERFGLRYVGRSGAREPLVMLHRALYGSLERFLAIVLEHHGGDLPAWLSPQQVRVLPVAGDHVAWAERVERTLRDGGLRAAMDRRNETLSRRIAEAHADGVPLVVIVGARETANETVTLRSRDGQSVASLEQALVELKRRSMSPFSRRDSASPEKMSATG